MNTLDISISFTSVFQNILEIEEWVKKEKNCYGKFQDNWKPIQSAFDRQDLVTASYGNKTIGFFALRKTHPTVTIDLAETHPNFRGKGIGRKLLDYVINHLKEHNFYAIDLQCAPLSSEPIWKRLGFVDIPKSENKGLYIIIKPYLKPTVVSKKNETLEIWDSTCTGSNGATYRIYNLQFKKGTRILQKPIVLYADYDWRVKWKTGSRVVRDCRIKDLYPNMLHCLVIEKLPKILQE